jgi:hypothetical protein
MGHLNVSGPAICSVDGRNARLDLDAGALTTRNCELTELAREIPFGRLVCRDGRTYAGITTDVAVRSAAHSSGKGAKFTRSNPPVRVLGAQAFASKSEALNSAALLLYND